MRLCDLQYVSDRYQLCLAIENHIRKFGYKEATAASLPEARYWAGRVPNEIISCFRQEIADFIRDINIYQHVSELVSEEEYVPTEIHTYVGKIGDINKKFELKLEMSMFGEPLSVDMRFIEE